MKKHTWLFALGAVLVVLGGVLIYVGHTGNKGSLESVRTTEAPWPADADHLKDRLTAIGLPALTTEGQALHIHQHLDMVIHGKAMEVPTEIGIHEGAGGFIASVHTHDTSGIIHVESPTVESFHLGQFFDIWGVRLTTSCIGGYCTDATNTLTFYVNGAKYEGDPRNIELTKHEELVVVYGAATEAPATIPATYAFPDGY